MLTLVIHQENEILGYVMARSIHSLTALLEIFAIFKMHITRENEWTALFKYFVKKELTISGTVLE